MTFFYKQDVEVTVNLRYVTSGSIKTSRRNFDPESGHIKLLLSVEDPAWHPNCGFDN